MKSETRIYVWLYVSAFLFIYEIFEALVYNLWGSLNIELWGKAAGMFHPYHVILWFIFFPMILITPMVLYMHGTKKKESKEEILQVAIYVSGVYFIVNCITDRLWYYWTNVEYGYFEGWQPIIFGFSWWCWISFGLGILLLWIGTRNIRYLKTFFF